MEGDDTSGIKALCGTPSNFSVRGDGLKEDEMTVERIKADQDELMGVGPTDGIVSVMATETNLARFVCQALVEKRGQVSVDFFQVKESQFLP